MERETKIENQLIIGDNLQILKSMPSEYVDLIYLDPPFCTQRDFIYFNDIWKEADTQGLEAITQYNSILHSYIEIIEATHSKAMKAYITYITQRMIELHRILKKTGSIYLHCDPTASHYLKQMMDCIFGRDNFRNEIVWQRNDGRGKGSQHKAKKFGANTDIILFYSKTDNFYFKATNDITDNKEILQKFNKIDENGKRYYTGIPIFCSRSMGDRPNLCYEWKGFINPYPSGWRLSKERLEEEYKKGNIVIREDNGKIERRKYLESYQGKPIDNNWIDIPRATGNEYTGYPTQKPLALLHRIIKASSKEGDLVLDPFCGCATTCVASEQLKRKWIGIDIEAKAVEVGNARLKKIT